jgi:hypothetical protein
MKRITILIAGVLILAGFVSLYILEIQDARGGKTVFAKKVSPGETFSITFVHSVEKSPVTDYFRIDNTFRIILYETAFRSLNTGLPATISEGQKLTRTDKEFHLSIRDKVLPDIHLWVNDQYAGTLEIGGKVISLAALAGNTLLRIRVKKILLWEYAFRIIQ